jgi:hypothetical protein
MLARFPPPRGASRWSPSRLPSLEPEPHLRTASYPLRVVPRSVAGSLRTQVSAGRRTTTFKPGVPSLRPAYKGRASASTAQAAAPGGLPVHAVGEPPLPANTAAGQPLSIAALALLEPIAPPSTRPRPEARRNRARRGRAHGAPPAGQLPAPLRPPAATNRLWVSPSPFPTPSPVKPATGAAQFRPEPPPPWPRATLRLPRSFQGVFREPGTYL